MYSSFKHYRNHTMGIPPPPPLGALHRQITVGKHPDQDLSATLLTQAHRYLEQQQRGRVISQKKYREKSRLLDEVTRGATL